MFPSPPLYVEWLFFPPVCVTLSARKAGAVFLGYLVAYKAPFLSLLLTENYSFLFDCSNSELGTKTPGVGTVYEVLK